eukprot:TRINITY_DN1145_c0_g1_i2.p2 TRINITY_DN1145_c0_g1~~TRINITY_DN1145_c0_g1_i2.p2  ORF type:complete len:204 (+),score=21.17 TRINITY_DN1145_c0_g1_i2:808-1419(+)
MTDDSIILFRVRKTICEMLHDRGYVVPKSELEMTKEEWIRINPYIIRKDLPVTQYEKPDGQKLRVYITEDLKLSTYTVKKIAKEIYKAKVFNAILTFRVGVTPMVKQGIGQLLSKFKINLELFKEEELMVNITQHVLVPRHLVLAKEEKDELLKKYSIVDSQLPRILSADPISRYFGVQRGQVFKIKRPSETAGDYYTYRVVV